MFCEVCFEANPCGIWVLRFSILLHDFGFVFLLYADFGQSRELFELENE